MALVEVKKARRQSEEFISISGKYTRLLLFFKVYDLMKDRHGSDFDAVRFYTDDKEKGRFWMRPEKKDEGGLPIRLTGKNRIISIFNLLQTLGWKNDGTVRLPVSWDSKNKAWMVDCRVELKEQRRASQGNPE